MSQTRSPSFARLAAEYDRVRPVDENWREIYELVVDEADLRGSRLLDCGCGTGRLAAELARDGCARVWGVDAEPRMLDVARSSVPPSVRLVAGRAESLPFRDGSFDRAVMWLVCHLVERPAALAEIRRVLVPGGRLALITFDHTHFDGFWLNAWFPSLAHIDRRRFPTRAELAADLETAGFAETRFLRRAQRATLTRDEALERVEQGHISTFDLLPPEEVRRGRAEAQAGLPDTVEYGLEWLIGIALR